MGSLDPFHRPGTASLHPRRTSGPHRGSAGPVAPWRTRAWWGPCGAQRGVRCRLRSFVRVWMWLFGRDLPLYAARVLVVATAGIGKLRWLCQARHLEHLRASGWGVGGCGAWRGYASPAHLGVWARALPQPVAAGSGSGRGVKCMRMPYGWWPAVGYRLLAELVVFSGYRPDEALTLGEAITLYDVLDTTLGRQLSGAWADGRGFSAISRARVSQSFKDALAACLVSLDRQEVGPATDEERAAIDAAVAEVRQSGAYATGQAAEGDGKGGEGRGVMDLFAAVKAHLDGKGLLGPGWSPGRVRLCWEAGQAAKRRVLAGQMRFTDDEIDAVAQVLQSDPDIRFAPMAVKAAALDLLRERVCTVGDLHHAGVSSMRELVKSFRKGRRQVGGTRPGRARGSLSQPWTKEEVDKLVKLTSEGVSKKDMVGFFPGRSVNSIENKMRDMTVYSDWRRLKDACGDDWADERTQRLIQAIKGIVGGLEQGMPAELRDKEVLYRLSQRADLRECWGRQRILMFALWECGVCMDYTLKAASDAVQHNTQQAQQGRQLRYALPELRDMIDGEVQRPLREVLGLDEGVALPDAEEVSRVLKELGDKKVWGWRGNATRTIAKSFERQMREWDLSQEWSLRTLRDLAREDITKHAGPGLVICKPRKGDWSRKENDVLRDVMRTARPNEPVARLADKASERIKGRTWRGIQSRLLKLRRTEGASVPMLAE